MESQFMKHKEESVGADNWKMMTCKERVGQVYLGHRMGSTAGTVCGERFGRAAQLREHQVNEHGKRFATQDDILEALRTAKELMKEFLCDEQLVCFSDWLHYNSTRASDPNSSLCSQMMGFLDLVAVKELD